MKGAPQQSLTFSHFEIWGIFTSGLIRASCCWFEMWLFPCNQIIWGAQYDFSHVKTCWPDYSLPRRRRAVLLINVPLLYRSHGLTRLHYLSGKDIMKESEWVGLIRLLSYRWMGKRKKEESWSESHISKNPHFSAVGLFLFGTKQKFKAWLKMQQTNITIMKMKDFLNQWPNMPFQLRSKAKRGEFSMFGLA